MSLTNYHLAAVTTFLSAALLFQVQPLICKRILPWFGGGSMVWITALFFFMLVLFAGYLYVLWLSRFNFFNQKAFHLLLIVSATLVLIYNSSRWSSGITPVFNQDYFSFPPVWSVLLILSISVGLPFLLLSTTSSLLQLWYAQDSGREPFSLYAISNTGSLLGLLSYPFLVEPLLNTTGQGQLWVFGFGLYVAFLLFLMWRLSPQPYKNDATAADQVAVRQFLLWVVVASVPVMMMLTSTSYITGFVASVPFIWIVPLALYLLSFVISFRPGERRLSLMTIIMTLVAVSVGLVLAVAYGEVVLPVALLGIWVGMFAVAHYCHEWLYEHRPAAVMLPWFYVALSLGGVFGSSLILVSTLFILKTPLEFILLLSAILIALLAHVYRMTPRDHPYFKRPIIHTTASLLLILVIVLVGSRIQFATGKLANERNFFGTKSVYQVTKENGDIVRGLSHEVTIHGYENMTGQYVGEPSAYYAKSSGVGMVLRYLQARDTEPIAVAVIGLGAGALGLYCRAQDNFEFFEIDPQVIGLALQYFNLLDNCGDLSNQIKIGDARQVLLALEASASKPQYDLIIMDAYADDAAPAHLMTKEAMELYLQLLKPGGYVAFNISSRYLNLLPVIAGLAEAHNLAIRKYDDKDPLPHATMSTWVIVSREENNFADPALALLEKAETKTVLWTDTYNALWPVVRFTR